MPQPCYLVVRLTIFNLNFTTLALLLKRILGQFLFIKYILTQECGTQKIGQTTSAVPYSCFSSPQYYDHVPCTKTKLQIYVLELTHFKMVAIYFKCCCSSLIEIKNENKLLIPYCKHSPHFPSFFILFGPMPFCSLNG